MVRSHKIYNIWKVYYFVIFCVCLLEWSPSYKVFNYCIFYNCKATGLAISFIFIEQLIKAVEYFDNNFAIFYLKWININFCGNLINFSNYFNQQWNNNSCVEALYKKLIWLKLRTYSIADSSHFSCVPVVEGSPEEWVRDVWSLEELTCPGIPTILGV